MSRWRSGGVGLFTVLLLAAPVGAQPGEDARPARPVADAAKPREADKTKPRKAEETKPREADAAKPRKVEPVRPVARDGDAEPPRATPRRRTRRELPGDPDNGLPALEADPFKPPKGQRARERREGALKKNRPWFLRPSLMFVARFSPDRSYLPKEGFGFGIQAGALLGTSSLRVSLSLNYHFYRVARTVEIVVNSPQLESCTEIRSISHHLATASASAVAVFSGLTLYAGLRGGFAYGELNTPNDTCGTEESNVPTGVIGPEMGLGYALKPDLFIGVNLAYLHFFSKEQHDDDEGGVAHRVFYPILTAGAHIMLRF